MQKGYLMVKQHYLLIRMWCIVQKLQVYYIKKKKNYYVIHAVYCGGCLKLEVLLNDDSCCLLQLLQISSTGKSSITSKAAYTYM